MDKRWRKIKDWARDIKKRDNKKKENRAQRLVGAVLERKGR